MKPRIRLWRGLWRCFSQDQEPTGIGYTPRQAWLEWRELCGGEA